MSRTKTLNNKLLNTLQGRYASSGTTTKIERISSFRDYLYFIFEHKTYDKVKVDKDIFDYDTIQRYKCEIKDNNGQLVDYSMPIADGRRLRIQQYDEHYIIYWERANFTTSLLSRLNKATHEEIEILITLMLAYRLTKKGK